MIHQIFMMIVSAMAIFCIAFIIGRAFGKIEGIKEEKERRKEIMEAIDAQAERHTRVIDRAIKR